MKASKARPLHEGLFAEFHALILSQAWPPGFQLPSETELAAQHGVSRMTMNKVLTRLTREGYLLRRRKSGTCVASPRAEAAVMALPDIGSDIAALGLSWQFRLLSRQIREASVEEQTSGDIPAGSKVLALRLLHFAGDSAFCLEERIISLIAAPAALTVDFALQAPGDWLRKEIPWSSAEQRIRAVSPQAGVSRDLGLASGEACLEVTRRTEIAGQWVTLVRQTFPGSRHQLVARFEPRPGDAVQAE